jgi:hypothetical protein
MTLAKAANSAELTVTGEVLHGFGVVKHWSSKKVHMWDNRS